MILRPTLLLLLAPLGALSHALPDDPVGVHVFSRHIRLDVAAVVDRLERRQAPSSAAAPGPSSAAGSGDSSAAMNAVDPTVWDIETKAACMESLRALNGTASNPSGLAVCYNLPSLNNATGQFKADLRLYRVAPPTAEWEGIPDGDISADLRFKGAAVTPKGNGRRAALEPRQSPSPSMPRSLKTFSFDGKMTPELVSKAMNLAQLRAYLAPNVTITAVDGNGQRLSTQLSSDDASFVNGLLKDLGTCSTLACTAEEKARPAPFVMPGTSLGIFPTGLLLTCLWALIGLGVVGWGTFGRYKFREQFRRRKQRDGRTGPA